MSRRRKRGPALSLNLVPVVIPRLSVLTDYTDIEIDAVKRRVYAKDLETIKELGEGEYGFVKHQRFCYKAQDGSDMCTHFAVKLIRCSMDEDKHRQLLMDLNVGMRISKDCPFVVQSFGAMVYEGDVHICMELMDMDLNIFYKRLYNKSPSTAGSDPNSPLADDSRTTPVPMETILEENILIYIIYSVVSGLEYLRHELKIIHRDVKPSNMLTNKQGCVKVCDFGISGHLVNSFAMSNIGCELYLSPERVKPEGRKFTIKSDVWSLGISILEIATGTFPYSPWVGLFERLNDVVDSESPSLPSDTSYSSVIRNFIDSCLQKDPDNRPKYLDLLNMDFLLELKDDAKLNSLKYDMGQLVTRLVPTQQRLHSASSASEFEGSVDIG